MILVDVAWLEAHPATSQLMGSMTLGCGLMALALSIIITGLAKR